MAAEDWIPDIFDQDDLDNYYDSIIPNRKSNKVTKVNNTTVSVKNKFYCGATDILSNGWAKPTLEEAIKNARKILDENPDRDKIAIVQIIRVVTREKTPIKVMRVK